MASGAAGQMPRPRTAPRSGSEAARAVIAKKPDHADAHARLGQALLEEGRRDAAIEAYATAVRLNPAVARFREGLARARGLSG